MQTPFNLSYYLDKRHVVKNKDTFFRNNKRKAVLELLKKGANRFEYL